MKYQLAKTKLENLVINFDRLRKPLSSREREGMKGKYPYYGAACVFDYVNDYIFDGDYILLGEDGTVLNSDGTPVLQRITGKTWVNNHAHVLRNSGLVDFDYLFYLLKNTSFVGAVTGAVQPKISQANMNSVEVLYLPDKMVQKKIAALLKRIDRKILINEEIIECLLEQGLTLFNKFCTCASRASQTFATYRFGDLCPVKTGKQDAVIADSNGIYPFFTCSQEVLRCNRYSFDGDAILVAGNGDFSVKFYKGKFEAYQRTYVLIPEKKKLHGLLFFAVKTNLRFITADARGSVIKFITKGNLENFVFDGPTDLMDSILLDRFNVICTSIHSLEKENEKLSLCRDSLLPRLISGEIDIDDIEV